MENAQAPKGLQYLAEEEQQKFWQNFPQFNYNTLRNPYVAEDGSKLTEEQLSAKIAKDSLIGSLKSSIDKFFTAAFKNTNNIKALISLPAQLSLNPVMGSSTVINMLTGQVELDNSQVGDFVKLLIERKAVPDYVIAAQKLVAPGYINTHTLYSEVIWLNIFCSWLGCGTSAMNIEISKLMEQAKQDEKFSFYLPVQYENPIEQNPESHARRAALLLAVGNQYATLEQILNRL